MRAPDRRNRLIRMRAVARHLGMATLVMSSAGAGLSLASERGQAAQRTPAVAHPVETDSGRRNDSLVEGVVKTIDRPAGRIVLRHGAIENLGIPPMILGFRVKNIRAIESLDPGTAVRFAADRVGGVLTIVHIERIGANGETSPPLERRAAD